MLVINSTSRREYQYSELIWKILYTLERLNLPLPHAAFLSVLILLIRTKISFFHKANGRLLDAVTTDSYFITKKAGQNKISHLPSYVHSVDITDNHPIIQSHAYQSNYNSGVFDRFHDHIFSALFSKHWDRIKGLWLLTIFIPLIYFRSKCLTSGLPSHRINRNTSICLSWPFY